MKKLLIILFLFPFIGISQDKKWFSVSKNDVWVMGMEVGAGYATGWREEVNYHHYNLLQRYPRLFKNGNTFWDGRIYSDGVWDANHMLKGITVGFHMAAICIKVGDIKNYPKKDRWKRILFDAAKYYLAYQAGFALSYNLTHHNPIF